MNNNLFKHLFNKFCFNYGKWGRDDQGMKRSSKVHCPKILCRVIDDLFIVSSKSTDSKEFGVFGKEVANTNGSILFFSIRGGLLFFFSILLWIFGCEAAGVDLTLVLFYGEILHEELSESNTLFARGF